ncbi:unnamed protein product, partial [Phaeothamnion confervicola]
GFGCDGGLFCVPPRRVPSRPRESYELLRSRLIGSGRQLIFRGAGKAARPGYTQSGSEHSVISRPCCAAELRGGKEGTSKQRQESRNSRNIGRGRPGNCRQQRRQLRWCVGRVVTPKVRKTKAKRAKTTPAAAVTAATTTTMERASRPKLRRRNVQELQTVVAATTIIVRADRPKPCRKKVQTLNTKWDVLMDNK